MIDVVTGFLRSVLSWRIALTLALAAAGGWVFHRLHLPLPWMLGGMTVTMLAALSGVPLARTRPIRPPFAAILGVMLGSAFQPSAFTEIGTLLMLVGAITLTTILCGFAGYQYLRRVAGFDPITAYFAGMPAGLQEMALQGGLAGGDERRIALIHGTRIFLLVMVVPLAFAALFHVDSQSSRIFQHSAADIAVADWLWLIGAGAIGWWLAKRLGVPNAPVIGPLLLSAAIHLGGASAAAPPPGSIVLAQLILGSSLGSNFIGTNWSLLWHSLRHGLCLLPILVSICLGVALLIAPLAGLDRSVLFLSLAPGGTTEMSLIALALHANVALVTSSQLVRILLVNVGAVWLFRSRGKAFLAQDR
ncbi:AbrB family transcriptional regulator [Shinella sp.]|uniref:AbrB family transcriptional regulator n=1 Tax=Shinella sp. TaxID=1870904 RepID=UPI00289782FB|nr:AbrB family transcriptional regulator [Shinella sp.]